MRYGRGGDDPHFGQKNVEPGDARARSEYFFCSPIWEGKNIFQLSRFFFGRVFCRPIVFFGAMQSSVKRKSTPRFDKEHVFSEPPSTPLPRFFFAL